MRRGLPMLDTQETRRIDDETRFRGIQAVGFLNAGIPTRTFADATSAPYSFAEAGSGTTPVRIQDFRSIAPMVEFLSATGSLHLSAHPPDETDSDPEPLLRATKHVRELARILPLDEEADRRTDEWLAERSEGLHSCPRPLKKRV